MSHHSERTNQDIEAEPTTPEKRGRFSKLLGRAAVSERAGADSLERALGSFDKKLSQFEDSWDQAESIVQEFLDNPQTREQLKQGILEYRNHNHGEDDIPNGALQNQNRIVGRFSDRDLPEFVGAHVLSARFNYDYATRRARYEAMDGLNHGASIRESVKAGTVAGQQLKLAVATAELRWKEVKGMACHTHMPHLVEFFDDVEQMGKASSKHYERAYDSAGDTLEELHKQIGDKSVNVGRAHQILDLVQDKDKLDTLNPTLVKLLASDFKNAGRRSVLGRSLEAVGDYLGEGALLTEFLDKRAEHNHGDNYINFTRQLVELHAQRHQLQGEDIDGFIASTMDMWPSEMTRDYMGFASAELGRIKAKINEFSTQNYDKRLLFVDADSVAVSMERLLVKFKGKIKKPYAGNAKITPKEALREPVYVDQREAKEALESVAVLLSTQQVVRGVGIEYVYADSERLDGLKSEIVARNPGEKRLGADIDLIIEQLMAKPFNSRGTMVVHDSKSVAVGGKPHTVRRMNPGQFPGLSVGRAAKQVRIIYTVVDRNLAILDIVDNHNQYERSVQKYL